METKEINIVAILEDCQKGMKLYSPALGVVEYSHCKNNRIFVIDNDGNEREFFADGRLNDEGECMLLPSKDMRNWDSFPPFNVEKTMGDEFFFIMERLDVFSAIDDNDGRGTRCWEVGNYFNKVEQARYAANKVKELLLSLRKEAK